MKISFTISITKDVLLKVEKSSRRKAEIEAGTYGCFKNKTFKDKKAYVRKDKHQKSFA